MTNLLKATIDDLDTLVRLRLDFLRDDHPTLSEEQTTEIETQLRSYFQSHLPAGDCICRMISVNNEFVAVGMLLIDQRPGNLSFVTGMTGTILNVFTYPAHRRKGYSMRIMQSLIDDARQAGISCLSLSATEAGKPLYDKLGFTDIPYAAMMLSL